MTYFEIAVTVGGWHRLSRAALAAYELAYTGTIGQR